MIRSLALVIISCFVLSCSVKKETSSMVTDSSTQNNTQNESTINNIVFIEYNGTIEKQETISGISIILIEHHQQLEIQGMAKAENLLIWNTPIGDNKKQVGSIILGEVIEISKLIKIKDGNSYEIWLNINSESLNDGWIYYGKDDPYANGIWSIIGKYQIDGKSFTIRKLEQDLGVITECNMYKHPINKDTELIKTIKLGKDEFIRIIRVLAITEETDSINNEEFFWVQIMDEDKAIGWIKSIYLSAERGGPLFLTPNNVIDFNLGFEP